MSNGRSLRCCMQMRKSSAMMFFAGMGLGVCLVILTKGAGNLQAGFRSFTLQHRASMDDPAVYTVVMNAAGPPDVPPSVDQYWAHLPQNPTGTTRKSEDLIIPNKASDSQPGEILDLRVDCPNGGQQQKQQQQPGRGWSHLTTNDAFLIAYLQRSGLTVQRGLGQRRERLDSSFETALLCSPPLTHTALLPNEEMSKVRIIDEKPIYEVGDSIQFRVDLYDGRGMIRTSGGDVVRMWLKSDVGNNSVTMRVVDLNNGSYLGLTELKWPGLTLVQVSLTYPREFLRLAVELRHTLHTVRWVTHTFVGRGGVSERTACLPTPPIPGYAALCNLTAQNGGFPWFCGHPSNPQLTCHHSNLTGNLFMLEPLPLSESASEMVRRIDGGNFKKLIPNDVTIITAEKATSGVLLPLPPCWSRPREQSWTSQVPLGWVQNGAWQPNGCSLPRLTLNHMSRCMKNTGLLLLGDSNMDRFFEVIRELMGIGDKDCSHRSWAAKEICKVSKYKTTLIFMHHSKPFNIGLHTERVVHNESLHQAIPLLLEQKHTNNVAVIHYYVHNSFYPLHMFRLKVQNARKVIEDALNAHPSLKIIIRGPHVIYDGKEHHAHFGDTFGPQFTQIWKEEFQGLYDKVWFLDLWDLSIAMENMVCHPPRNIMEQMIRVLFGYFCEH